MNEPHDSGKQRGLRNTGCRDTGRAGAVFNFPELRGRKVIGGNRVVDDRGYHAILPLPTQEGANLLSVHVADQNEKDRARSGRNPNSTDVDTDVVRAW